MYDEKDNSSDIIYEDYSLQMELALSADQAVNLLKQALILQGSLTDADGHVDGVEGNRQYAVIAVISEMICIIICCRRPLYRRMGLPRKQESCMQCVFRPERALKQRKTDLEPTISTNYSKTIALFENYFTIRKIWACGSMNWRRKKMYKIVRAEELTTNIYLFEVEAKE